MKRAEILVGEDYAVVHRRTQDNENYGGVRGVVQAVGQKRKSRGMYGTEKNDGILVRFDVAMVQTYSTFRPLDPTNPRHGVGKTEVIIDPRCVLRPWAEQVAMNEAREIRIAENQRDADEAGDEYEPIWQEAHDILTAVLGKEPDWSIRQLQGTERKRTVNASIKLGPKTIISLANFDG